MNYRMELYPIEIDDGFEWVAESLDFPNCVGQGKTKIEAIAEYEGNLSVLIDFYNEEGIPLPKEFDPQEYEYSGKISLRMSKSLHGKTVKLAKINGVSLNAYIVESIAEKNGKEMEVCKIQKLLKEMQQTQKDVANYARIGIMAISEVNKRQWASPVLMGGAYYGFKK